VAETFKPVNHGAMQNPKINHIIGDAREFLMAKGKGYDLIISEPSNPYRAGVASLDTLRSFTSSVHDRLNADGLLCQWVQGYEASPETIDTGDQHARRRVSRGGDLEHAGRRFAVGGQQEHEALEHGRRAGQASAPACDATALAPAAVHRFGGGLYGRAAWQTRTSPAA